MAMHPIVQTFTVGGIMTGTAAFVQWYAKIKYNMDLPAEVNLFLSSILNTVAHALTVAIVSIWGFICAQAAAKWGSPKSPATPVIAPTVVTREAGFARLSALLALAGIAAVILALAGCAGLDQAVAAKMKSDKVAVQAANDNYVDGIEDAIATVPVGTVMRRADFVPIVKAALLPAGQASGAATLFPAATGNASPGAVSLTPAQVQQITSFLQSIGVTAPAVQATPAAPVATSTAPVVSATPVATAATTAAPVAPVAAIKAKARAPAAAKAPAALPKPVAAPVVAPASPTAAPVLQPTQAAPAATSVAPAFGIGSFLTNPK